VDEISDMETLSFIRKQNIAGIKDALKNKGKEDEKPKKEGLIFE
jgi:hypothetical protein